MRIRYLTPFAGRGTPTVRAGDERDVEPAEAKRLIERGLAASVASGGSQGPKRTQKRQKATAKPPEKVVATE